MNHDDLLIVAKQLASISKGRPKQAELKRAVSSAYYALFHKMAHDAADLFAGGRVNLEAWQRIYRALEHGPAKAACQAMRIENFDAPIIRCATAFVKLQEARHLADYDPLHRLTRLEVEELIDLATASIAALTGSDTPERRRFAAHLLFRQRRA